MVVNGNKIVAITGQADMITCLLFLSTDYGNSWVKTDSGLTKFNYFGWFYSLDLFNENIYVGTENKGILLSTDFGKSWMEKPSILSSYSIQKIANNGDYIFAGTNAGVFRAKLSDFTDIPEQKPTKPNINIFPNPANNYIEISNIELSQNNIQIFNILGEMVLSNYQLPITDYRKIDISTLTAGVYYLKIGNEMKMFVKE